MRRIYNITNPEPELLNMKGFRDSFRHILQKELPDYKDVVNMEIHEQMLYHSLLVENTMPVRIIFGYYGYTSEFSLREGFYKYIEEEMGTKGFSPTAFPDLIICGKTSMAKLDAMPYIGNIDKNGYWNFYGTTNHNPLLILLEFIWTKLSYKYDLNSDMFGEDLDFEVFHPYLVCKAVKHNGSIGWAMKYITIKKADLEHEPLFYEWKPAELNEAEFFIVNFLCNYGVLNINEPGFLEWLNKKGFKLENVISGLKQTSLVTFKDDK